MWSGRELNLQKRQFLYLWTMSSHRLVLSTFSLPPPNEMCIIHLWTYPKNKKFNNITRQKKTLERNSEFSDCVRLNYYINNYYSTLVILWQKITLRTVLTWLNLIKILILKCDICFNMSRCVAHVPCYDRHPLGLRNKGDKKFLFFINGKRKWVSPPNILITRNTNWS
jgi:hypothetical protein